MSKKKSQPRGRPSSRVLKIDASPEEVARQIFSHAKPPDPSLQKPAKKKAK